MLQHGKANQRRYAFEGEAVSTARVVLRHYALEPLPRHVRVDGGGGNVGMAQQHLHGTQIGPVVEQVRSKGRPGDLVTEADLAAEAAVLAVLHQRSPLIGVLAEEAGLQGPLGELQWCVDPLDGTTNYAHGFPLFACTVGLLKNGKPILGEIQAPALQQSYWGGHGLGAYCNGELLQVSGCNDLSESLLVTGFAYDRFEVQNNNYTEFCYFSHRSHGVRRGGAASLDLAFVAAGRLDGYWERGLQPWDLAAGVALIEAAHGLAGQV